MHTSPRNESPAEIRHPDRGAARIYAAIFGGDIPATIRERFVHASQVLDRRTSAEQLPMFENALDRIGDLEALELAARYAGRLPTLCDRFRLMVYLCETDPAHQIYYVAPPRGFMHAMLGIAGGGLRTAAKLIKGRFLLGRVGHA